MPAHYRSDHFADSAFTILRELIESDIEIIRQTRFLPDTLRARVLSNHARTSSAMLDLVRLLAIIPPAPPTSTLNPNATNFVFTIPFDLAGNGADMEDVPIVPSEAVVEETLVPQEDQESVDLCTVCQETMGEDCSMLRNCQHMFHDRCIRQWFTTSPRCPVCRNDIREESVIG
jgi:hypothetical protein